MVAASAFSVLIWYEIWYEIWYVLETVASAFVPDSFENMS